ncbi:MAG: aminoglycoside phosphotransferase [Sphingobacteriia bacterium]|nr:aminoglycoside phosphotransferase [Sphingobacteriia bacterium]
MEGTNKKMETTPVIEKFLKQQHLEDCSFYWLTEDASRRRYGRIQGKEKSYILMDSPISEHPYEFVLIDEILTKNGLSAPLIYAKDLEHGLILLEDFGDETYATLLTQNPSLERELYIPAIQVLEHLQSVPTEDIQGVQPYAKPQMMEHLSTFVDWFMPYILNKPTSERLKNEFFDIWERLIPMALDTKQGLILWDFHINNLMKLNRKGVQQCGLLDFQDARIGPYAYDLVALLEDARRHMDENLRQELFNLYLKNIPVSQRDSFVRSYHILGVKRHLRVLGFFVRLYGYHVMCYSQ